jgi:hypothetical protein
MSSVGMVGGRLCGEKELLYEKEYQYGLTATIKKIIYLFNLID